MMGEHGEIVTRLAGALGSHGLTPRGWFAIEAGDIPAVSNAVSAGLAALLVGNHGPAMWSALVASDEYGDGEPHPMDRWTRRIIGEALASLDRPAIALFPFGGEVWPFQRFASRAMGLRSSPLGLLIHPDYGLWHALRAAIVFPGLANLAPVHVSDHPCDDCAAKPCLGACPVEAFTASGFAVQACRSHLATGAKPDCVAEGCAARNACPVGRQWRYGNDQLRFHMVSFRG
jgi:NAD-dependent dihydropyrimidine dehydrogenase PreA subunit